MFTIACLGKPLTVEVEGHDRYRAAFGLAELDAGVGSTEAVIAFERDGKPDGGELDPLPRAGPG